MTIDNKKYRLLKTGEIIRKTDVFQNGHEVEKYVIGTKYEHDRKFKVYWVYRQVAKK